MPNRPIQIALSIVAAVAASFSVANSQDRFPATHSPVESPPVFRVQEVVAAEIIQGPDYHLDIDVPVRQNLYLYKIHTPYGDIQALGSNMLEQRLREMHAIENACKLVRDPQLVKGIVETFRQTPQGARVVLTDPGGTIMRAPKGFRRMASNLLNPQNARAGGEDRRRFAVSIGCDPETTNPVLIPLLDNLAVRKSIGKNGSNLGMNVVLPGLGLLSVTKDFDNELITQSPSEINSGIEKELQAMGVWEPVARQFCRERSYTTMQRMIFMGHLRTLKDVQNFQYLVYRATTAYDESEGLGMIRELRLIRRLHEQHGVISIDLQGLPVVMLRDSSVVIVNASDYIFDSQDMRDAMASFRRTRPNDPAIFITAGKVSEDAKVMLANFDVQVVESGNTTMVERIATQTPRR
ncbi:hypothetical protein SAMN06265222_11723 [Neorhodopirellula lusitana]|uniref:Uncharacterized protein n=1 Tax=Neorhodopirellula lusitana TaxID=445327 RepID=A0ABY1QMV3_9BACT|nr:hypothetical protein [Neorhodopirellula lusitana]SMP73843.1 hypothetical protein SAMN06265222_11723 [Neorhodopirellula lusitana]